jgi:hypothetical protein
MSSDVTKHILSLALSTAFREHANTASRILHLGTTASFTLWPLYHLERKPTELTVCLGPRAGAYVMVNRQLLGDNVLRVDLQVDTDVSEEHISSI